MRSNCFGDHGDLRLAGDVVNRLYDHQLQGVAWLAARFCSAVPGAVLADDMGLGKSIQVA
eukprot:CAMPEP_0184679402 /NCGR_PEP_ID=MMETSP0312-20130426/2240_1 /TAXON_ID=31354 /ORGANISM="Compsopogon coeruleus, Strain SAG 36.94" /LENGTH=59 /DNA_ID=CAMNT_0027128819 /DNA_START=28 /DNA_END=204 /DNA_ORIENTATION=+